MISTFNTVIQYFTDLLRWWVVIAPWEQGIRVRLGKHAINLAPGIHFRIPYVDHTFVQSVRKRVGYVTTQTLMTKDQKTVIVGAQVAYSVCDVRKLYNTLHDASATISGLTAAIIADLVTQTEAEDLNIRLFGEEVTRRLTMDIYGIEGEVRITDFSIVRVYRVINDARYSEAGYLDMVTKQ